MPNNLSKDTYTGESLEFAALFDALSLEYRRAVTLQVLRYRPKASGDSGRKLDSAIRGSIRFRHYRDFSLIPAATLLETISNTVCRSGKLAGAVLQVWVESREEMRRLVAEHLNSRNIPDEYPDFSQDGFRSFWDGESWQRELDWIVELPGEWDEDDVALMLCYVSGRTIGSPTGVVPTTQLLEDQLTESPLTADQSPAASSPTEVTREVPSSLAGEAGDDGLLRGAAAASTSNAPPEHSPEFASNPPVESLEFAPVQSGNYYDDSILARCLEYLQSLPPGGPEWAEAIPDFAAAVIEIMVAKAAEIERVNGLAKEFAGLQDEFMSELESLERDAASRPSDLLSETVAPVRMLELAAKLKDQLMAYRNVRQGAVPAGEVTYQRERERLSELEPRILDALSLMEKKMPGVRSAEKARSGSEEPDPEPDSKAKPKTPKSADGSDGLDGKAPLEGYGYQPELVYEPVDESIPAGDFTDGFAG